MTTDLTQVTFALLLLSILGVDLKEWAFGSLSWQSLWRLPATSELTSSLGPLAMLPGLLVLLWLASRLLERPRRPWRWGRRAITLPLLGLTALVVDGLDRDTGSPQTVGIAALLGLIWLVYLYVANERPNLTIPLALALALQGSIAVGQFLCQRDLGLNILGEPVLDRAVPGVSVVTAMGQRWLRAYGLTGHPNLLGMTLATSLLLLLPALGRARGPSVGRMAVMLAVLMGFLGLLASFSRASWLGFGVGAAVWVTFGNRGSAKNKGA